MLGLLLGPVYYGYCQHLSGKVAQTQALTERAERWIAPDGAIMRFHGGLAYKPIPLALHPDMNRVALRLRFSLPQAQRVDDTTKLQYQASLLERDHTVLERPVALELRAGKHQGYEIGPFEVPYPASYLLVLEEVGKPGLVPAISLSIIEKIEQPNMLVVWTGLALLILAFLVQLHALWKNRRHLLRS